MLYAACVPGFLIGAGMQFAVESPRWLAKVSYDLLRQFNLVIPGHCLHQKALSCRLEGLMMPEKL
jgi:hypothetical protein